MWLGILTANPSRIGAMADRPSLPAELRAAAERLTDELRVQFGPRVTAIVAYGPRLMSRGRREVGPRAVPLHTLALVDVVGLADLEALAPRADAWRRAGLAMPLLLGRREFERSLDAFPVEYGAIIAHHVLLAGPDPFTGLAVHVGDLRRACETLAKSHLIHLREGFLETGGRAGELATMLRASAVPFSALLGAVARLEGDDDDPTGHVPGATARRCGASEAVIEQVLDLLDVQELSNDEARRLYPAYLDVVEKVVAYVDRWRQ